MTLTTILVASTLTFAQGDSPPPTLSANSLTAEQIAVYQAVLHHYTKGDKGSLNIANKTEPLDKSGFGFDTQCFKELQLPDAHNAVAVIHKLARSFARDGERISLVDPDLQRKQIKANDPQNLVKSSIDEHMQVTDTQLDDTIKRAFDTGLFTLSEILFDKGHRHALVAYSFVCGDLCGNGNLLLLTKVGSRWKVTKTCGGWVS